MATAKTILPEVYFDNRNLPELLGNCIMKHVMAIVGKDDAPMVVDLMNELPVKVIRAFLKSFEKFEEQVAEA